MKLASYHATLHTASGVHPLAVRLADRFCSRLRGLMLAPPLKMGEGLLLTRCGSVHSAFMLQAIDLVYLDQAGRVLRCVAGLAPWRVDLARGAAHVLELASGSILHFGVGPGDWLAHPCFRTAPAAMPAHRQDGAAMVEFVIVGPVLALLGLAVLQYSLLYVARNQVNHAGFMAARAGSMHNATAQSISNAYVRNLAPMYGGGRDAEEIAGSLARAAADMQGNYRIELLNPGKASFDSFNDPALQKILKTEARVIPNSGLALKDPSLIKQPSKQNIFDANLLKLRITHGYQPKVMLVAGLFVKALEAADTVQEEGKDGFVSILLANGRVPVVTDVTLHMNSDAIEWADPVWISGGGAGGNPQTPLGPPRPAEPPVSTPPVAVDENNMSPNTSPLADGDGDVDGNAASDGSSDSCGKAACPVCKADIPASESFPLSADVLFDFDKSTLKTDGLEELDDFIEDVRQSHEDGQRIASITISGYTDQLGSDVLNQRLSLERAEAVRDYMKQNGFPDVPVTVRGMGAADPKVPMESCTGGAQEQMACLAPNRRVLIEIKRTESKQ